MKLLSSPLEIEEEDTIRNSIILDSTPTWLEISNNQGTLSIPNNFLIGNISKQITTPFSKSPSDQNIDRNATSKYFQKYYKVNVLNEQLRCSEKAIDPSKPFHYSILFNPKERISNFLEFENTWQKPFTLNLKDILPSGSKIFGKAKEIINADKIFSQIEEFYPKLSQKFKIIEWDNLRQFLVEVALKKIDNFIPIFYTISEETANFFKTRQIKAIGKIEKEVDYEDENVKTVKMTFSIKNSDVKTCLELSKELITDLAEKDKESLKFIQIQIVPE